jgi:hypothetical protein
MNPFSTRRPVAHSGQFFGIGVTVGVFVGLVVGSIVALRLGEDVVDALKELGERLAGRRDRVNFELLLQ